MEPQILAQGKGIAVQNVSAKDIEACRFPLPPEEVRDNLAAQVEMQWSRLDAGVTALKRVQANLKRYRASVLKAACEGRLVPTEAELARREGRPYGSGADLLKTILISRLALWEATEGKRVSKKYVQPKVADETELPLLPEGWAWVTAEQLTNESRAITYGVIKLGKEVPDGIAVLRSSDVRHLRLDLDGVKRVSPEIANQFRRTFLRGKEVLITVRGTLGGVAVAPAQCAGYNISREVAMLALVEPRLAELVAFFIGSVSVQNWLMRRTKGIAYTGVNIETLKALPIPLPPLAEQQRIVAEVERRLSVIEEVEADVAANLKRAERLKQSLLARAFGS